MAFDLTWWVSDTSYFQVKSSLVITYALKDQVKKWLDFAHLCSLCSSHVFHIVFFLFFLDLFSFLLFFGLFVIRIELCYFQMKKRTWHDLFSQLYHTTKVGISHLLFPSHSYKYPRVLLLKTSNKNSNQVK
jgi:hypothetical protein